MKALRRAVALICIAALASCGASDHDEQIGSTAYRIVGTDSQSHWIFPSDTCGAHCPSISRDVEVLDHNRYAIAVRQRVVIDRRCDDRLVSTYTRSFRQYVIVLSSNRLLGPFDVAQYESFVALNPQLMQGIDLLKTANRFDGPAASAPPCPAEASVVR